MKYQITELAVQEWIYDEVGEIEIIDSVPWYVENLINSWYLVAI